MKKDKQQQPNVSPAARALLEELDEAGPTHRMSLKESGRRGIVEELVRREHAVELEDGHIVSTSWADSSLGKLGDTLPCDHRAVAKQLALSNGQARAFLAHLVQKGVVRRSRGWFSLVSGENNE